MQHKRRQQTGYQKYPNPPTSREEPAGHQRKEAPQEDVNQRHSALETLVDPLWRLVSRHYDDGDKEQAQDQGVQVFAREQPAEHKDHGLTITAHTPIAPLIGCQIRPAGEVDLEHLVPVIGDDLTGTGYERIIPLLACLFTFGVLQAHLDGAK